MTTLALILAQECFFGEDVMIQCTPQNGSDKPGLPYKELVQLEEDWDSEDIPTILECSPGNWVALVQVFGLHRSGMQEAEIQSQNQAKPMPSIPTANTGTPNTTESLV